MPEPGPPRDRAPDSVASSSSSARPFRPQDEPAGVEHALGRVHQLGAQGRVLALEVDLRNHLGPRASGPERARLSHAQQVDREAELVLVAVPIHVLEP